MRILILSSILFSSALASADGAMPPIDPASVPPACAGLAAVPADAAIPWPAIYAHISAGSCAAEQRFNAMHPTPDDAGLSAMMAAAKPSIDMLDAAIAANDPTLTPIAKRARADLFASMVVRMRDSIPAITMQSIGPTLADHDAAHAALEPKLAGWTAQAQ